MKKLLGFPIVENSDLDLKDPPVFKSFSVLKCEAIVPERWYAKSHRCPYKAIGEYDAQRLCGIHLRHKLKPRESSI